MSLEVLAQTVPISEVYNGPDIHDGLNLVNAMYYGRVLTALFYVNINFKVAPVRSASINLVISFIKIYNTFLFLFLPKTYCTV